MTLLSIEEARRVVIASAGAVLAYAACPDTRRLEEVLWGREDFEGESMPDQALARAHRRVLAHVEALGYGAELTEELASSRRPLVSGALKRRDQFPSRQEAYDNFASKPPLESFDARALRAYVECGFRPDKEGVRLKCPPFVEASIYRQGLVHDGFTRLPEVRCPVTIGWGERSVAMDRAVPEAQVAALPDARLGTFPELGHFGPMEGLQTIASAMSFG